MIDPVNDKSIEIPALTSEVDEVKLLWDEALAPFRETLAYGRRDMSYRLVDEQERLRLANSILGFVRDGCTLLRDMIYAEVIPLEREGLAITKEVVEISQRVLAIDGYASAEVNIHQEPASADIIDFPAGPDPSEHEDDAAASEDDVQPEPPAPPEDLLPAPEELPEYIEVNGYRIETSRLSGLNQHESFILSRLPYLLAEGSFARKDVLALGFFPDGTDGARAQAFKKAIASLSSKLEAAAGAKVLASVGNRATSRYVAASAARTTSSPVKRAGPPVNNPPGSAGQEPGHDEDDAPEPKQVFRNSIAERMEEPLELKLAARPAIQAYISQKHAKSKKEMSTHDQSLIVLSRHFGIGAEDGAGIDMISLSDTMGLSPYSIRNFVREALKACDSREAKAYLDYLDSQ